MPLADCLAALSILVTIRRQRSGDYDRQRQYEAKITNQIIVALNIAAMSEASFLAAKAGVDLERVIKANRGGLAGSTVGEAETPTVLVVNFKPGLRIAKGLQNAIETPEVCAPIPLACRSRDFCKPRRLMGRPCADYELRTGRSETGG
jgi:2-hydroxy-3-oxopropionate reductase